jgi:DNA-binding MarR family transcriptional regulator
VDGRLATLGQVQDVRADPGQAGGPCERDQVDVIVDFLLRENPGLDAKVKSVAIRLRRAAHHLEKALRAELNLVGIEMWELEILLSLRRAPGHCRSAGELWRESQVTSGAITNRIDRLQKRGWVGRSVGPVDRRHVLVSLTVAGLEQADKLLFMKVQAEQAVFGRLGADAQDRLNRDLKALLLALEGPAGDDDPLSV